MLDLVTLMLALGPAVQTPPFYADKLNLDA